MPGTYWLETLGCPKNRVDSDKIEGVLAGDGMAPARRAAEADLLVVNTCAFIEAAREESVETILALAGERRPGARLVVTGCMAERYGQELADALPEVDLVAGFGVPLVEPSRPPQAVPLAPPSRLSPGPPAGAEEPSSGEDSGRSLALDLLNLPRPAARAPWAYVKIAEGCDRSCGFCAIPSFRGRQRSRSMDAILAEVDALGAAEVVLVAQDLASYGRDCGRPGAIVELVRQVCRRVERVRLLYLYPSALTASLIDAVGATGVPYFDLSLQHASGRLLRLMRRWGRAERFLDLIAAVRDRAPGAALRSSFIVGYPGETEEDQDELLAFLAAAQLDWAGFFTWSPEEGTAAMGLPGRVPEPLVAERLRECGELQDAITATRRAALVGTSTEVLVDAPGRARSYREAPEIDGVVVVPDHLTPGSLVPVVITASSGPDLLAEPVGPARLTRWQQQAGRGAA